MRSNTEHNLSVVNVPLSTLIRVVTYMRFRLSLQEPILTCFCHAECVTDTLSVLLLLIFGHTSRARSPKEQNKRPSLSIFDWQDLHNDTPVQPGQARILLQSAKI